MEINEKVLALVQSLMEFIETVVNSDSPMMTHFGLVHIHTGEQHPAVSIWAGKVDDEGNPPSPIKRIGQLVAERDALKQERDLATRWIPVEEALPTKQGHYLVKVVHSFYKNCKVMVAEFYDDNQTFYDEAYERPLEDVTHWRKIEL